MPVGTEHRGSGMEQRTVDPSSPVVLPGNVAPVPAYLALDLPVVASRGYAPLPEDRFQGTPRSEPGVVDVLALTENDRALGTYEGSSRPSLGMW